MTTMKWTPQEVADAQSRMSGKSYQQGYAQGEGALSTSKYHAVLTECDGIKFQSKKEARVYRELCARIHAGEIKFFLMQVPFRLSGGYKHRLDFMAIKTDGSIEYIEAKGRDLLMGKMKRKMVESEYKIRIEVV